MACWKTFQNISVCAETIPHDHLSNSYWYAKVVLNNKYQVNKLHSILIKRFYGIILPYTPHPKFRQEHEFLKANGYVKNNLIIYQNQVIGHLINMYKTYNEEEFPFDYMISKGFEKKNHQIHYLKDNTVLDGSGWKRNLVLKFLLCGIVIHMK